MNCKQFHREIERAIEERFSSASLNAKLADHADSCESCRLAWQDFLLLESALATWTEPVEVDLVDRVVSAARADRIGPRNTADRGPEPFGMRRTWFAVTAAAVLVIGIAFAFRTDPDQTADSDSPVPSSEPSAPFSRDLNEDDQYAGVDDLIASTRDAWKGIASKAVDRASGFSVFVPDLESDLGLPVSSTPDAEETPPEVQVDGQEPSLIPGNLNRAFEFLLEVSDVTTT